MNMRIDPSIKEILSLPMQMARSATQVGNFLTKAIKTEFSSPSKTEMGASTTIENKTSTSGLIKLATAFSVIPLGVTVLYFAAAGALKEAFKANETKSNQFPTFNVDSSKPTNIKKYLGSATTGTNRAKFMATAEKTKAQQKPVIVAHSSFVPKKMTEHLMRNKRDSAIGTKYLGKEDKITNMEGALHTFLTPICPIVMTGDYYFDVSSRMHTTAPIDKNNPNMGREVILSAAVQPDFESNQVIMKLVEITDQPVEGKELPGDFQPLAEKYTSKGGTFNEEGFKNDLKDYETALQHHMAYQLTSDHRLPSLSELSNANIPIVKLDEACTKLEEIISKGEDIQGELKNMIVDMNGHKISMEALYNVYLHQMKNELGALENALPGGYVYTIDPPSIFASQLGGADGAKILNRLQILAIKQINQETPLTNLKTIGFNNYDFQSTRKGKEEKNLVDCFKEVFAGTDVDCKAKSDLFNQTTKAYIGPEGYALVVHNNSDAFGQNIETEGPLGSLDGAYGNDSNAAVLLSRDRPDLMDHTFTP